MIKIKKEKYMLNLFRSVLLFALMSVAAQAQPAHNNQILTASGGDAVAMDTEWAVVGDTTDCTMNIYKLNYTSFVWEKLRTILDPEVSGVTPCDGNKTNFGASVAVHGNFVVVGHPNHFQNDGRAYVYEYNGTDWNNEVNITAANGSEDNLSMSVGVHDNGNGTAEIVVGAPNADVGSSNGRRGHVYTYTWTSATSSLTQKTTLAGISTHTYAFGQSLDIKGDYLIVGAPDEESTSQSDFVGAAYTYHYDGSSWNNHPNTSSHRIKPGNANERVGTHVAINSDGNVSMLADFHSSTYVYTYAGGATLWTDAQDIGFRSGGGVDTDDGVYLVSQGGAGHLHYDINPGGTNRPLSFAVGGDHYSIAIYKEQSIISDISHDQAIAIDVPCGIKPGHLKAFEWAMVSVPCGAGTATIDSIFTDDLGTYGGGAGNWLMYEQNGTDWSGTQASMRQMGFGDAMKLGKGYWIITDADKSWKVDAPIATRTQLDITGAKNNIAGYYLFDMPSITLADQAKKIMVGNPFPRKFDWSNTDLQLGVSAEPIGVWPTIADPLVEATAYVYDSTSSSGQPYNAIAHTPGFPNQIEAYQGFWIRLNPVFDTTSSNVKLRPPFKK